MRVYQLDTNIILRYLINDDQEKIRQIQSMIKRAKAGEISLFLSEPIVLESAATLKNYYKFSREKIAELIAILCSLDWLNIENKDIVTSAIHDYEISGLDFADCLLLARVKLYEHRIFTFDEKLKRITAEKSV